jgi:hypothetical protein
MVRVVVMLAVLGALAVSCMMAVAPCPCGQSFDRDPFGSDDGFFIGAEHDESVHCFCRCGDGPRERLAPSMTCEAYEGPCEARNGEIARYVCE